MLIKIPYPKAMQITERYKPSEELQDHLSAELSPEQLIQILEREKLYQDLVVFLAHGLPPRECVAWGLTCCNSVETPYNQAEKEALIAAKVWYQQPDEPNRRFAEQAAQKAELQTAPGWVAQAVFWSSGSITAPETPVVAPPPWLYCHAIAGAVNLAAVLPDGSKTEKRYPLFIKYGVSLAAGQTHSVADQVP
ncbi:hypothetical protein [Parendozoicomonas sp. Alg238-R29]|uniref:DUF6931 family protein n=1 Tax=Parendozoicomonas sp. Alg238-R29 TaxID=2993446 RepID=UPI00248DBB76|nr:hypothetical protein [Parendozoicomonas sp. Alg238-R29]